MISDTDRLAAGAYHEFLAQRHSQRDALIGVAAAMGVSLSEARDAVARGLGAEPRP